MLTMFKKAFWVPYKESDTYPTVAIARQAIAKYCGENGFTYEFTGEDEVTIDGKAYEIYRGYDPAGRGNYGIRCRER